MGFFFLSSICLITKHRVQPPSVNTENYNIFYKFQYLSHFALIGSQTLSDCVVCGMMSRSQPQNKISSNVIPVSSTASIPFHSIQGQFSCSLYCLAHLRVYHKRQHFAFRFFLVHTLDNRLTLTRRRTLPVKPCPLLWQICAYFLWFCASSLVKQI